MAWLMGIFGALILLDAFDLDKGEVFSQAKWAEVVVGCVIVLCAVVIAVVRGDDA